MTGSIRTFKVCVYGSSSPKTPKEYLDAAYALGKLIAARKHVCVNGGGDDGVMGAVNRGCFENGGKTIGVLHRVWDGEEKSRCLTEEIIVDGDDLKERKKQLTLNADCFIIMPGGTGTLDELWETVSHRSLNMGGLENIPLILVNINGFYDGCIQQMQRCEKDRLLYLPKEEYFHVSNTVDDALDWAIRNMRPMSQSSKLRAVEALDGHHEAEDKNHAPAKKVVVVPVSSFLLGLAAGCLLATFIFKRG